MKGTKQQKAANLVEALNRDDGGWTKRLQVHWQRYVKDGEGSAVLNYLPRLNVFYLHRLTGKSERIQGSSLYRYLKHLRRKKP